MISKTNRSNGRSSKLCFVIWTFSHDVGSGCLCVEADNDPAHSGTSWLLGPFPAMRLLRILAQLRRCASDKLTLKVSPDCGLLAAPVA